MAKLTVRDFAKCVGLATSGGDYIACTVMLKMLCAKGVAKEVDRINTSSSGRGRKSVVYEISEQVSFPLDLSALTAAPVAPVAVAEETVAEETAVEETVAVAEEVVAESVEAPVAVAEETVAEAPVESAKFFYDDDEEDEAEAA